jgi:hypothetical protein
LPGANSTCHYHFPWDVKKLLLVEVKKFKQILFPCCWQLSAAVIPLIFRQVNLLIPFELSLSVAVITWL